MMPSLFPLVGPTRRILRIGNVVGFRNSFRDIPICPHPRSGSSAAPDIFSHAWLCPYGL